MYRNDITITKEVSLYGNYLAATNLLNLESIWYSCDIHMELTEIVEDEITDSRTIYTTPTLGDKSKAAVNARKLQLLADISLYMENSEYYGHNSKLMICILLTETSENKVTDKNKDNLLDLFVYDGDLENMCTDICGTALDLDIVTDYKYPGLSIYEDEVTVMRDPAFNSGAFVHFSLDNNSYKLTEEKRSKLGTVHNPANIAKNVIKTEEFNSMKSMVPNLSFLLLSLLDTVIIEFQSTKIADESVSNKLGIILGDRIVYVYDTTGISSDKLIKELEHNGMFEGMHKEDKDDSIEYLKNTIKIKHDDTCNSDKKYEVESIIYTI